MNFGLLTLRSLTFLTSSYRSWSFSCPADFTTVWKQLRSRHQTTMSLFEVMVAVRLKNGSKIRIFLSSFSKSINIQSGSWELPAVVKNGKFSEKSSWTQIAHVLSFLLSDSLNCEFFLSSLLRVRLFCSNFQSFIYLRNIDLSFLQDEHLGTVLSLSYNLHFCFVGFLFHGVNDLNFVLNFNFVYQISI